MRRPRSVLAVAAAALLLAGCSLKHGSSSTAQTPAPSAAPSVTASPTPSAAAFVDPASVNANELGEVPVFMFHQVKQDAKGDYDQTPEHFNAELLQLYNMNFRPITAANFVAGQVNVPAGMHPMVMTFDDGTTSQAQIGPDGNPVPTTALGMMEAFGQAHPDFHPTATFYVNENPFQDPKVLPWLVAHGYDVGVHTVTHANLKQLDDANVQKEVGGNYQAIQAALPGFKITTMALPFGVWPVNKTLAYQGTYSGQSYSMSGVMLVGSNPSPSPYATSFKQYAIPRIRSGPGGAQLDAGYWLTYFQAHPGVLYVSDGDPSKVSFPAYESPKLAASYQSQANGYGSSTAPSTSSPTSSASPSATPSQKATKSPSPSSTPSSTPAGTPSASPSPSIHS
ncbi:MAG TPA: polysaccharide deacetylase family protein [Sporichthyaceae bacterium]|jgi:peptidoglycan/xylan/chitin deacetylase (PgdA/CDA1 family)|nr:polysaccharide deacetylase family protein [Sporichthyaceae bacterium]